jgi:hypothetical protein
MHCPDHRQGSDVVAGQAGAEQGFAAGDGRDHAADGRPRPEPVDGAADATCQVREGKGVEVAVIGEQQLLR